ncbi:hypothetical protein GGF46_000966 [Coemansia sp. RSA 552]|nr:hypothetical protein GGF46_000966 [Coemansia sp. RSA 552]
MSSASAQTLSVLDSLARSRPSKRVRKERARQAAASFVRSPHSRPAAALKNTQVKKTQAKKTQAKKTQAKKTQESRRDRNAGTLRAADRLVTKRCKALHQDVLELLQAQEEQRRPKLRKRKHKLTFFDFEDRS